MARKVLTADKIKKEILSGEKRICLFEALSFSVYEHESVSIMGRSGSGKSTLLGILAGLDILTYGAINICGTDITKLNDNELTRFRNENIGLIYQNFNLIPSLSALENIEVPLTFSRKAEHIDAKKLLEQVGLEDKAKIYPSQLSGGEQQRIAIARALINSPKILLADEPTGALDGSSGQIVMELFKKFQSVYGMAIIIVTHDDLVGSKSDRILLLENGELKMKG